MGNPVKFPLTEKELATFYQTLQTLDFEYFSPVLSTDEISDKDIEKIAVVKAFLEQINDVVASRIDWYVNDCGLQLPAEDKMDEILDKYSTL